jgi:hypothetical protein
MGVRENPDLELFGFWQTTAYVPKVAKDGKVPRNDYGNVELFQISMLPIGCVHIKLQNLNKVCRPLGIDCAPAVVGFDAHHGFSHAVYDGWVVCEEFKDVVIDAAREEERQSALKLIEKQKEKIWINWRKLIKSLLVRERIKIKYGDKDEVNEKKKSVLKHKAVKNDDMNFDDDNDDDEKSVKSNGVDEVKKQVIIAKPKKNIVKKNTNDESEVVESNKRYSLRTKGLKPNYKMDGANSKDEKKKTNGISNLKNKKIVKENTDYFPDKSNKESNEEESINEDDYAEEFMKTSKKSNRAKKLTLTKNKKPVVKEVVEAKDESLNLSENESD